MKSKHQKPQFVTLAAILVVGSLACKKQESNTPATPVETTTPTQESTMPSATATVTNKENAIIETTLGTIEIEFFPEVAPNHVENFKKLSRSGFYDSTTFHRVIPGFMIQGGDPNSKDDDRNNDGTGGPGYTVNAEFNDRPHLRGTLSMARAQDPNSAGSQFFICVADAKHLDGKYTVFGQVIKGIDVVDKIVAVQRDKRDNPLEKIVMKKVTIAAVGNL